MKVALAVEGEGKRAAGDLQAAPELRLRDLVLELGAEEFTRVGTPGSPSPPGLVASTFIS